MKIQIEETVYEGTATEIMGRLRDQTFDPTEFPDIESYIWFLQSNVIRTTGTLQNYELQFRGSGFATVSPKKGSVVHGLLWKLTPKSEQALDRYEGYPRHYTKEQVSVRTTDDAAVSVMAYIMAEPMSRQPALPSPYYYRAIQQGFEANGLPVESLEEAWNRTIDEVWSGKVDRPQKRNKVKPKGQER